MTSTLVIAAADTDRRRRLARELDLDGHQVHEAPTASAAAQTIARVRPTLIVLGELEALGISQRLLRELRAGRLEGVDVAVPVLTLGASDLTAQLRAYEHGSDHHLDADADVLLVRAIIAAGLRRAAGPATGPRLLSFEGLEVDVVAHEVRAGDRLIELTPRQFELLRTLASNPTRVFTKTELLQSIWGYEDPSATRTLDTHACPHVRLASAIALTARLTSTAIAGRTHRPPDSSSPGFSQPTRRESRTTAGRLT